jgi:hypothetical protein
MKRKSTGKRTSDSKTVRRVTVIAGGGDYSDVSDRLYFRKEAESLLKDVSRMDLTTSERKVLKTAASLLPPKHFAVPLRRNPVAAAKVKRSGPVKRTVVTNSQAEEVFKDETLLTSVRCELYEALCKNSKRYKGLVDNIRKNWGLLIGAVAGAVAAAVGVAVTVISALVASVLALISAIGIGVFCRRMSQRNECGG